MTTLTLTPTTNTVLPFKTSGFSDLTNALEYAAKGNTGFNFYNANAQLEQVLSYTDLLDQSLRVSHCLLLLGLKRGDHLPVIAETRAEFLILFYACQYLGIIICPCPMFASVAERSTFATKTLHMASLIKAKFLIASNGLINAFFTENTNTLKCISFEQLTQEAQHSKLLTDSTQFSPIKENTVAFMQFSSGSTSKPKGIRIYNHDVCEHVRIVLEEVMKLRAEDRSLSWLPFYHNMGLIGFIIASVNGQRSVDCFSPFTFVGQPSLWLKLMSCNKTAITYAPMFAYQLAIRAFTDELASDLDLSTLRVAGIGGDTIHLEVMKKFHHLYAPYGFEFNCFLPSYGMTEAILAISAKRAGEPVIIDHFENKELVSCGHPLSGYQLTIKNANPISGRSVGNICFKNNAETDTLIGNLDSDNGIIDTGDIGYLHEDNLFILGRQKDVILIRGRNIWTEDIKTFIASNNNELTADNIVVSSIEVEQEDRLVVMIQHNQSSTFQVIKKQLKKQISQQFNLSADIVFVNELPLTPSGKIISDRFVELYTKVKDRQSK
ncbi:AMP-binding protein [Entomomonas moraniae]|nr:AMP-binding protein [Entomomonas moraniae]